MNESDRYLPGDPPKRLIKAVRKELTSWGIRVRLKTWRNAWQWASAVAHSYITRTTWPCTTEVASQYVALLLLEMKECRMLKLPYRAFSVKGGPALPAGEPLLELPAHEGD